MTNTVYSYLRISSRRGNDISIDRQKEVVQIFVKDKGLSDSVVYLEEQRVSGGDASRKEYNKLLELIESGKLKVLVVYSLCRLVRDLELQTKFVKKLIERKIQFYSITDNISFSNPTPEDIFQLNLYGSLNQMFKDKCSQRLKLAWKNHKTKGLKTGGLHAPYGFDLGEGKKLVPNPKEQQVIQLVKQLRSSGQSYKEIGKHLLNHNIKTKTGLSCWNSKTLKFLIERNQTIQE